MEPGHPVELAEELWTGYLDSLSLVCGGSTTVIQREHAHGPDSPRYAFEMPLRGIRYDPVAALLEVSLGGSFEAGPALRCFIAEPARILADSGEPTCSVLVLERSGARTLIRIIHGGARNAPPRRDCERGRSRRRSRRRRLLPK